MFRAAPVSPPSFAILLGQRRLRRRQRRPCRRRGDASQGYARDALANAAGFHIATIALTGQKQLTREEILADRRHHRPLVAAVSRCRRRAHAAEGQSLDRRRDRAEALSRPAAYRSYASGRPLRSGRRAAVSRDRGRRRRGRALCRRRIPGICRWLSAPAPRHRRANFWRVMDRYPEIARTGRAPMCWSPSGAGI